MISKQDITEAHTRIASYIYNTPILTSSLINEIAGCDLYFKCENFQRIGAFKMRGAANAVLQLSDTQKANGVTTHSSGNHAQALAKMAQVAGIKATIVMPKTAPQVKVNAVKQYGASIVFCEPTLQARETAMQHIVDKTGATFIPPYNHEHIITGQATAAKELITEQPDLAYLITPVGGGGLLAGSALSAHYFSPHTQIIGAEPDGADDAYQSFKQKILVPSIQPNTIADGLLTSLGPINFEIIKQHVSDILCVSDEEIKVAMRLIWERMKIIIEPSSAVALAVVLKNPALFKNKQVGIIISGGNVDLGKLPF
jgi:threonine dehydratase